LLLSITAHQADIQVYWQDSTARAAFKDGTARRLLRMGRRGSLPSVQGIEGRSSMLSEFKEFIAKGNVMDLAVAVIIGGAFATIVASLTNDIIMPIVGAIFGGADFTNYFIILSVPDAYDGPMDDFAALQEAGAAMIGYGAFISAVINFLILAFIIFLLVRSANRLMKKQEEVAPAPGPSEIDLLTEIRDALKERN